MIVGVSWNSLNASVKYIYKEANGCTVPLPKLAAFNKLIIFPLLVLRAFDIFDATHFRLINSGCIYPF